VTSESTPGVLPRPVCGPGRGWRAKRLRPCCPGR
jgi:hypothetical protein